jgi:hypothetical protein
MAVHDITLFIGSLAALLASIAKLIAAVRKPPG